MTSFNPILFRRRTLQIVLGGLLFTSLICHADERVRTSWLQSLVFASEREAITSMSQLFLAESIRDNTEHMGAILETEDGRILVTHGKAEPGQDRVEFSIRRPKASRIIALWHTHGAPGRATERFSVADSETVRETGLPFYLISPRGRISVLEVSGKRQSGIRHAASESSRRKVFRISNDLALYRVQ